MSAWPRGDSEGSAQIARTSPPTFNAEHGRQLSRAAGESEQSAHLPPRHVPALSARDLVAKRAVIDSIRYERVSLTASK
jgi:hypothetical protein